MDFLPHTDDDIRQMLERIGVDTIDDLFEPIPQTVRLDRALQVPAALDEVGLIDHVSELAAKNRGSASLTCFAGGGAYEHYVPAAVRALVSRGEFATSYTPYQPELSQGVLQAVFEFQSMVCQLYDMEVANASLYDGGSALVEAVNLSIRVKKRDRVAVAGTVHPHLRAVLHTWTSGLGIEIVELPFGPDGTVDFGAADLEGVAGVVVPYPNFFGRLEDVGAAAEAAHAADALCIAITDPTAMGLLRSPGSLGADVAIGEGQGFGNPMSYGGPYVGYFATKLELVRQVPGRIAGETTDVDGKRAFVLTLQAREQHIRRAKATSNVCTNQTLMAIASAVHMAWLGPEGLKRMGELCASRAAEAKQILSTLPGCKVRFAGPTFKEFVLETPIPGDRLLSGLAKAGFLAGPALGKWYPDMENCVLIATTERRTSEDVARLAEAIEKILVER